jgi:hypothetical protein
VENHRAELFNNALMHSLSTIQAAKAQFLSLTAGNLTLTVLVSQIRLCDVLLREIRAISRSLEGRKNSRGIKCRRSMIGTRNRGSRHLAVPPCNPASRPKQR